MSEELGQDKSKKERIVKIISTVIDKVSHNEGNSLHIVLKELRDLLMVIEETRQDISQARAGDITDKHIPGATDELDAIIDATSQATGEIMDCCDDIQAKASEIGGEAGDAIVADVMRIYEACSFQDITGQRVSKVVQTFRDIEQKIDKLVSVLGIDGVEDAEPEDTREGDAKLMNGPQLAGQGISQDDIDKLLAEFDDD